MFKLILLDYSMYGMDGPQTAKEIRRVISEHGLAQPHICCCSAYTEQSFVDTAVSSGMDDFMSKPVQV